MKRGKATKSAGRVSDGLRAEYDFDYAKAKPNRFAAKVGKGAFVVVLDGEIARFFKTPEAVKAVLLAIAATTPKRRKGAVAKRAAKPAT